MIILPVASGKGGVGKSLLSANLSIALGQAGKRVILADLDLGAANLHQILGTGIKPKGLGTFLTDSTTKIESVIQDTDYKNLRFLPGDEEIPGLFDLNSGYKRRLFNTLQKLDTDYLVLDLGAGTGHNILDFFLLSGRGIVITSPTLTATMNAYLFIKNAVFRIIETSYSRDAKGREYLNQLRREGTRLQRIYLPRLLEDLGKKDPDNYGKLIDDLSRFQPMLILNMLEDPKDSNKAGKIRRSCKEYLNVELEHLGIMYKDHLQDIALASRMPIIQYKPDCVLSQAIYRITDKILQEERDHTELNLQLLDESYQTADLEAEVDFQTRLQELEARLKSGALSQSELVETVRMQQFELNSLRKENQLLKQKLTQALNAGFKL